MGTLYEITDDLRALDAILTECGGEITEENEGAINAWFEEMEKAVNDKADGYACLIREFEARYAVMKAEADEFNYKAQTEKKKADSLKNRILEFMQSRHMPEIKTKRFTLKVTANGGKAPMDVDVMGVPAEFMYQPPPEPDKVRIREALEAGQKLPFAELQERGTHLRIR